MSLQYPAFNRTEWNFVSPDLSIIDTIKRYRESTEKIKEFTIERNAKITKECADISHFSDEVIEMAKRLNQYEKNEVKRQDALRMAVKQYQELKQAGYSTPIIRQHIANIIGDVTRSYFTFGIQKFREDISKCTEIEGTREETLKKEIQRLNGKIVAEGEKLKTILDSVPSSCVGGVFPKSLKSHVLGTSSDTKAQQVLNRQFAEYILTEFVSDWRERAAMFTAPVTITGVAIHTLPSDKRSLWYNAFIELGFDKVLGTKPVYMWIPYRGEGSNPHSESFSFSG